MDDEEFEALKKRLLGIAGFDNDKDFVRMTKHQKLESLDLIIQEIHLLKLRC